MAMKATDMIFGAILVSLVVGVFILFASDMATTYHSDGFDNSSFEGYQTMQEISDNTQKIQEAQEDISEKSGVLDIIGGYFSDAYQALTLTKDSFGVIESMADQGIEDSQIAGADLFKKAASAALIIMIILGIIIATIMKRDL